MKNKALTADFGLSSIKPLTNGVSPPQVVFPKRIELCSKQPPPPAWRITRMQISLMLFQIMFFFSLLERFYFDSQAYIPGAKKS